MDFWSAIPGAQAAYDYVAGKLAEWRAGGQQLPLLDRTAAAIQAETGTNVDLQSRLITLRQDIGSLRSTFAEWNPRIESAIQTIRSALGLGAVPILALTLIVSAAVVVGSFLNRRSSAERVLLDMISELSPEAKERVAQRLASAANQKGFLGELSDVARLAVIGGGLFLGYKLLEGRRRG